MNEKKKKKKNKAEREDPLFRNKEYMNENSILLFYYIYIYLLDVSFGISVIHLIKKESVTFNFLGANFSPATVFTAMKISL